MDTNTATANPILATLSTEALLEDLKNRGVNFVVKEPKAPKAEKVVKTPDEITLDALVLVVKVEEGKIVVIPEADLSEDAKVMREALWEKARTTTAAIEKSHRPAYTGKPRGPKKATSESGDKAPETSGEVQGEIPTTPESTPENHAE